MSGSVVALEWFACKTVDHAGFNFVLLDVAVVADGPEVGVDERCCWMSKYAIGRRLCGEHCFPGWSDDCYRLGMLDHEPTEQELGLLQDGINTLYS